MTDPFDVDLRDGELETEIHLLTDFMVAASQCPGTMTQSIIDAVLFGDDEVDHDDRQPERSQGTGPDSPTPTGDLRSQPRPVIPVPRSPGSAPIDGASIARPERTAVVGTSPTLRADADNADPPFRQAPRPR